MENGHYIVFEVNRTICRVSIDFIVTGGEKLSSRFQDLNTYWKLLHKSQTEIELSG